MKMIEYQFLISTTTKIEFFSPVEWRERGKLVIRVDAYYKIMIPALITSHVIRYVLPAQRNNTHSPVAKFVCWNPRNSCSEYHLRRPTLALLYVCCAVCVNVMQSIPKMREENCGIECLSFLFLSSKLTKSIFQNWKLLCCESYTLNKHTHSTRDILHTLGFDVGILWNSILCLVVRGQWKDRENKTHTITNT